ncbi:MAG: 50S ribosomal protein L19 [Planctomycetes bacterium GWF2_39_10]|nr:MAG: 50S ribosomal protein L19 [Planctomycetes bacterium GWA2_39_15]OHB40432.1 MAG: 50S ribosomal protein L19 [Planctomycetes bacterium GWC2_39_26]OHB47243.1 MAG: 50S ribosomal protein L19 [Planctomycetes bacterium GWF2_39_10]OHC01053.1 MAG: 50S ribosomal protein L19 [Planctomycetes bacterium RIFCSPLOWO2_12_FULL_39_13]
MNIIDVIEKEQMKKTAPQYNIGDQVDVSVKIVEGDKERIQVFSGVVIAKNGGGFKETFTVRRIVQGEGVERVFPIHSPKIVSVKVIKSGKVRRAKLYYMRERTGKGTRLQEKFEKEVPASAGEVLSNPNKNNT